MARKTDAIGIPVDELEELKRQRELGEEREAEEEFKALTREQRRYEIARDCMAAIVASPSTVDLALAAAEAPDGSNLAEWVATSAVVYADALLARLEKE